MDEENTRISRLITKYLKGEMTDEEDKELQDWVMQSRENYELVDNLTDPDKLDEEIKEFYQSKQNVRRKIEALIREEDSIPAAAAARVVRMTHHKYRSRRRAWKYIAVVCILLSAGAVLLQLRHSSWMGTAASPVVKNSSKNDVVPGGDKGRLVLADGSAILLDTAANGKFADQGGTVITKGNGGITYRAGAGQAAVRAAAAEGFNTLTTPRAGQFMVVLPDNSRVWLNNSSSLRYPISFHARKERIVELSGEAYFEVAQDAQRPFGVKMNGLTVNVLGTRFNVMAYADEGAIRTTLLEGKIKLRTGSREDLLVAGEQATVSAAGKWAIAKDIDTAGAIAWKNGFFHFDHAGLPEVMRQLARWYDVEPEFRGPVPDHVYGGSIRRGLKLSEVLGDLQQYGGHFSIEGRKLVVTP